MDLATVTRDTFDQVRGTSFSIAVEGGTVSIELTEVTALPEHAGSKRSPFSVVFQAAVEISQGTYHLEHETLGAVELFVVPIGGNRLEAIFN